MNGSVTLEAGFSAARLAGSSLIASATSLPDLAAGNLVDSPHEGLRSWPGEKIALLWSLRRP